MLTAVQIEILQSLINLYRKSKCTSVKCESIADLMDRNSGTIHNQMQPLRSLGLVQGVPGPRGGYKPTLEAYHTLNIENDPCEIHVPIYVNGDIVSDISVNKIEFTSILRLGDCEATISVLGDIKQLDLDDTIKIGPTPVNNLIVDGTIIGRDDVDNVLLIKTKNILSVPNVKLKDIANSKIEKISPDMELVDVCKILSTNNLIEVPVVNDNDIMGVIQYCDVINAIVENINICAKDFMTESVVTAKENISLLNGMTLLLQNNVTSLILLNNKVNISGIVSFTDMLKRLLDSSD